MNGDRFHLGLPTESPLLAPDRGPTELPLAWQLAEFFQLFAGLSGGDDLGVRELCCSATNPVKRCKYVIDVRVE
ncbi:MAG: hypothetical protein ACKVWV_15865 [Planctomycetota bacterium]